MKTMKPLLSTLLVAGIASLALVSARAQEGFEPPFAVNAANSIGDVSVRVGPYQGIATTPPGGSQYSC